MHLILSRNSSCQLYWLLSLGKAERNWFLKISLQCLFCSFQLFEFSINSFTLFKDVGIRCVQRIVDTHSIFSIQILFLARLINIRIPRLPCRRVRTKHVIWPLLWYAVLLRKLHSPYFFRHFPYVIRNKLKYFNITN